MVSIQTLQVSVQSLQSSLGARFASFAQAETAYGDDVYSGSDVPYGGVSLLDTPIAGIPEALPNTGREAISFLVAIGLFTAAYMILKRNQQRKSQQN